MNIIRTLEHPEVTEFIHICAVTPDIEGNKEVCELIKKTKTNSGKVVNQLPDKKKEMKEDKELDQSLKDTFPASDPITHY